MASQRGTLFQPTFYFPMVSVCVLAGAFLIYYFPVTARQEASLNRRAFRSLAAISDSLASRIANYVEVLEQRAKRPGKGDGTDVTAPPVAEDFVVTPSNQADCNPRENQNVKVIAGTAQLELICGSWSGRLAIDRILPPYFRGASQPLFDDVLLADAEGSVMFQSIATGSRINSIRTAILGTTPSQVPTQGPPPSGTAAPTASTFASASQSSTLVSTVLAGEQYRLYLVPIPLKLQAATTASSHLIIVGLMREGRFRADSLAVPGWALLTIILLVLVVMAAAWPLLKFATMSATDRIPRQSAVYLFLSTLATIILICIIAIHLRYTFNVTDVDANLQHLADSIQRNLTGELKAALRVMNAANNRMLQKAAPSPAPDCRAALATATKLGTSPELGLLAKNGMRLSDYPYFDRIFWADSRGFQHDKWEAGSPTSPTYVGDRDYFVEAAANRL